MEILCFRVNVILLVINPKNEASLLGMMESWCVCVNNSQNIVFIKYILYIYFVKLLGLENGEIPDQIRWGLLIKSGFLQKHIWYTYFALLWGDSCAWVFWNWTCNKLFHISHINIVQRYFFFKPKDFFSTSLQHFKQISFPVMTVHKTNT